MSRRRPLSRQKKAAFALFAGGIAAGVASWWFLVRKRQTPALILSKGGVSRGEGKTGKADSYTKGSAGNALLTAAQDAWYKLHPDEPFINDDGSCNIIIDTDGRDVPGCLNQTPPSDSGSSGES